MVLYHTVRRFQEKIYPSPNQPHFSMHIYTSAYKWMEKKKLGRKTPVQLGEEEG